MPRMNILGALEKEAHDTPPRFSAAERKKYFTLSSAISELVASFRSSTNKVCFVLAYGYFRAAKCLYSGEPHQRDLEYVCAMLRIPLEDICIENYAKGTAARHRQEILEHFGFSE
ncbi:MAG: DUF4158 domain-containing protein, partial [Phycisphaerales bacterium]|nr:DUF4158 domain-containing protein [Phycisphaerales bacterium]